MNWRGTSLWAWALSAAVCVGGSAARAETPPTVWHALGIPQAANGMYDATANRSGNRPGLERGWRLRRIADPVNMESEDLILQRSAEIKHAEDLAQQKIKGIKYVASVGCGCYAGVDQVLLAGLEDCTEAVRYATAQAIAANAYRKCDKCNQQCCCTEQIVKKLAERAYHLDEHGCFIEPSPRVRVAAECALLACCPTCGNVQMEEIEDLDLRPGREDLPPTAPGGDAMPSSPDAAGPTATPTAAMMNGRTAADLALHLMRNAGALPAPSALLPPPEEIHGRISSVDANLGTVLLSHDQCFTAVVGGEAVVYHSYLLGQFEVGKLRVVRSVAGQALCERIPGQGRLQNGDTVTFMGHRTSGEPEPTEVEAALSDAPELADVQP